MTPVLVVGGSGFLGRHLVERLLDDGAAVTVLGPTPAPCLGAGILSRVRFVEGSITQRGAVAAAIATSGARRIVSLAAFGEGGRGLVRAAAADAKRAFEVNVEGLRTLLGAATDAGIERVLWASSTTVYGDPAEYGGAPVDEESPPRPASLYGLTKALAEQVARFYGERRSLAVTGLRLPLLFGPGLWYAGAGASLRDALAAAARGEDVTIDGDPRPFDLMYVRDAAALFAHLLTHPAALSSLYNANGFVTDFRGIAAGIARIAGVPVAVREQPAAFAYPLMSTAKLERETGFRPDYDLERSLADHLRSRA